MANQGIQKQTSTTSGAKYMVLMDYALAGDTYLLRMASMMRCRWAANSDLAGMSYTEVTLQSAPERLSFVTQIIFKSEMGISTVLYCQSPLHVVVVVVGGGRR